VGDTGALNQIQASITVRPLSVSEDGDAVILVFVSDQTIKQACIDLVARPTGNSVGERQC
jgi:hypothetical protein